jgi:hypothetical protein
MMEIQHETRTFFHCKCSRHTFTLTHLRLGHPGSWGPWYCDACGQGYRGTGGDDITVQEAGVIENVALLLELSADQPVYLVVNRTKGEGGHQTAIEDFRYLIEEHQCPTNLMQDPEAVLVGRDDDRHGLFRLVAVADRPIKRHDQAQELFGHAIKDQYDRWVIRDGDGLVSIPIDHRLGRRINDTFEFAPATSRRDCRRWQINEHFLSYLCEQVGQKIQLDFTRTWWVERLTEAKGAGGV